MYSFLSRILRALAAAQAAWSAPRVPPPRIAALPAAFTPLKKKAGPTGFKRRTDAWPLGHRDEYRLYSWDQVMHIPDRYSWPVPPTPECGRDLIIRRAHQLLPERRGEDNGHRFQCRELATILASTHCRLHLLWVQEHLDSLWVDDRNRARPLYNCDITYEVAWIGGEVVLLVYHTDAEKPIARSLKLQVDPNDKETTFSRVVYQRYAVTRLHLPAPHFTLKHTFTLNPPLKSALRRLTVGAE